MSSNASMQPIKPSPQLADYLFAQRLMEEFQQKAGTLPMSGPVQISSPQHSGSDQESDLGGHEGRTINDQSLIKEMVDAGRREILGRAVKLEQEHKSQAKDGRLVNVANQQAELMPLKIAYAKLPYLLKTRRYRQQSSF